MANLNLKNVLNSLFANPDDKKKNRPGRTTPPPPPAEPPVTTTETALSVISPDNLRKPEPDLGERLRSPKLLTPLEESRRKAADYQNDPNAQIVATPEPVAPGGQSPITGAAYPESAPVPRLPAYPQGTEKRDVTAPEAVTWTADDQIRHNDNLINNPAYRNNSENKVNRGVAAAGMALRAIAEAIRNGASVKEALAGAVGAGIGGAMMPKIFADVRHQGENDRLRAQRKTQTNQEKADAEVKGKILDNQNKALDGQNKALDATGKRINNQQGMLDYLRSSNKPLYDSVTSDDVVTEDEAKLLGSQGYPVVSYDNRKFKETERNGKTYSTAEKGAPDYQLTPGLPVDPTEVPHDVEIDGEKMPMTSKQYAPVRASIGQGNAQRAQQQAQFEVTKELEVARANFDAQNRYVGTKDDFEQLKIKAKNERETALAEATAAGENLLRVEQEITRRSGAGEDISSLIKEQGDLTAKKETALAAIKNSERMMNAKPPAPPVQLKVPKLASKGGKNNNAGTHSEYQKALQRIKNSK